MTSTSGHCAKGNHYDCSGHLGCHCQCHSEQPPAFILNADLEPTGMLIPCLSRMTAHLGFDRPTPIPCGLLAGHEGWHRYEARWADSCEDPR